MMLLGDLVIPLGRPKELGRGLLDGDGTPGGRQGERRTLLGAFQADEPEAAILDERPACRESAFLLMEGGAAKPGLRALVEKKGVGCQVASAEIAVSVSMEAVAARLSDHVQDERPRLAKLGVVIVGDNLKLFHLFEGSAQNVADRDHLVADICAVHVDQVAATV